MKNLDTGYGRQSAKNVLKNKIEKIKEQATAHEVLLKSIQWDDLTDAEEAKLWSYFLNK